MCARANFFASISKYYLDEKTNRRENKAREKPREM